VNHEAGRKVPVAHTVEVDPESRLAELVRQPAAAGGQGFSRAAQTDEKIGALAPGTRAIQIPVNSSHHQAADVVGDGLRVVARSSQDGIIEALEGTSPDHFVLAVQWHPERSVDDDEPSRAIFRALVEAARARHEKLVGEFEGL
jgi:putative glutamine amidotransferase